MMKWTGTLFVVGLVATLGYGWYRSEMAEAEQRGRAEEAMVNLHRAQNEFQRLKADKERTDSLHAAETERNNVAMDSVLDELENARRHAHQQVESVDSLLAEAREAGTPDSVTTSISDVITSLQVEAAVCDTALETCLDGQNYRDARIENLLLVKTEQDSLLTLQARTVERLRSLANRKDKTPWLIAGGAVAVLIAHLVFN